jgi:hypothetical protein
MKGFVLVTAAIVAFATPLLAQSAPASRETVIAFLRREGILSEKTRVDEAIWNKKARWWSVSLRHPSGKITNWTVDADARNYSYVCQH